MQFFAVLSYHVDPSFLWSSRLPGSIYVAVAPFRKIQLQVVTETHYTKMYSCIVLLLTRYCSKVSPSTESHGSNKDQKEDANKPEIRMEVGCYFCMTKSVLL